VLLSAYSNYLVSQNSDSLIKILAESKEDTIKVKTLIEICNQQGDIPNLEKIKYAEEALSLSEKLNFQMGIITSKRAIGQYYIALGKYEEGLKYLNDALLLAEKSKDKIVMATIHNAMGTSCFYMGNFQASLSHFIRSAALFDKLKKPESLAEVAHNMGLVYYRTKDYQKARDYNNQAGIIYQQLKDTLGFSYTQSQFGNIAYDEHKYDTALVYYKRALKLTEKLKDPSYTITSLVGIGNVLFETGHYNEAMIYDRRVLEIARKIDDQNSVTIALLNLGKEYVALNKLDKSIEVLKEALLVAKKTGAKENEADAYSYLSETYEKKNDFKNALVYSRLYKQLNDSIFNEENAERINTLSAKYETEKKEKAIALLNAELSGKQEKQELLNAKVKEKNIIILSLIGGALLLFISVLLFFSHQKLKQKNKFQAELNEQQKNTASIVIQMQENERNRIARELHDGIGTFLSTLKINLQALENNLADKKMIPYKTNTGLIDKTAAELRKITKGLSNEVLLENGLAYAIQELVESINASGAMQLKLLTHGIDGRFDPILETNLYRIAQELINNSLRHSQATKVTLQLIDHDSFILLMLEDNGVGFTPQISGKNYTSGMGLRNIKNRIDFLGGTLKIESGLKKGSTFIVEVPRTAA
jgi:signal transduction histidine kinase